MTTVYSVYTADPVDMSHPLFMARAQARLAASIMFKRRIQLPHAINKAVRDITAVIPGTPPALVAATVTIAYLKYRAMDQL